MNYSSLRFVASALIVIVSFAMESAQSATNSDIALGTRVEMFVDNWLIDSQHSRGVSLQLQTPIRREVVLTTDKPWEGAHSAYYTALQDGAKIRIYYRGFVPERGDRSARQVTCLAESTNGINFSRPNIGLYEFDGSKENNIVYMGVEAHNFAPFLDTNPNAKTEERYKAVGGLAGKLCAFSSPDGIHWKKIHAEPVMTKGAFDSLNVVFWDEQAKLYRCYSRHWTASDYKGFRTVQSCTSRDFLHWTEPEPNHYRASDASESPQEHFYTSATTLCPGAPHHYLSFPMRFIPDRKKPSPIKETGASDAVFVSSRDGVNWDRTFLEAWVRPGLDDRNWTHRNNMPAWGIVQTGSNEFSMYISEHYAWPDNRLRRLTVRRHGFASVRAGAARGEFITRPLTFAGKSLCVNYATSAAGSLQVEIQDKDGQAIPGHTLEDAEQLFGDDLRATVRWKRNSDLSALVGKPIRLRFVMKEADLYAVQFP
jgi:hypothetical protein